jgi:hypothetical protein
VTFTFPKQFEEEACPTVTLLKMHAPTSLHSARVWTWFTEEAKAGTSGWIYHKKEGSVVSPVKSYTSEMLNDSHWDDDSTQETQEETLKRPTTSKMNSQIIFNK